MKTLYFNGTILTMRYRSDNPEAVLVGNGQIMYVGDKKTAETFCDDTTVRKDLNGKTLMPSFIDPHSHISVTAQFNDAVPLESCFSADEIVNALLDSVKGKDLNTVKLIYGYRYDNNQLPNQQHPSKEDLDKVSSIMPVLIMHASLHMCVVNSKFLEIAGITEVTQVPEGGGKIGREKNSNEPNGYLEESATRLIQPTLTQLLGPVTDQLAKAQETYLKYGITTVQDGAASLQDVENLRMAADSGKLKIDVVSYVLIQNPSVDTLDTVLAEFPEYKDRKYHNKIKIGGYKIVLDGSPQGRTAWLTEPYEENKKYQEAEDYRGYPSFTDSGVVDALVLNAVEKKQQILAHCNGDAASDQFLGAYKKALAQSTECREQDLRPVMIHCQTVRNDQLHDMVGLHMIPSIFVSHIYYWGDVHLKNFGEKRGNFISPAGSALQWGLKINFHMDTPVIDPNVLEAVWCAVNRTTKEDKILGPSECIDVYDALLAVTKNAAFEYHEEDEKGSLEVGKRADMVILDKNPLCVDKKDIKDIEILETIREGKTLYSAVQKEDQV